MVGGVPGGAVRIWAEIFLDPVGGVPGGAGRSRAEGEVLGTVGAWHPPPFPLGSGFAEKIMAGNLTNFGELAELSAANLVCVRKIQT